MNGLFNTFTKFSLEDNCRFTFGTTYEKVTIKYPTIDKVAIVMNHAFRAFSMVALAEKLPYSKTTNCAILTAGSFFYRATIEWRCSLKFAIPSCFGAFSYILAKAHNFSAMSTIPLNVYAFYVLHNAYTSTPANQCEAKAKNVSSCCQQASILQEEKTSRSPQEEMTSMSPQKKRKAYQEATPTPSKLPKACSKTQSAPKLNFNSESSESDTPSVIIQINSDNEIG